MTCIAAAVVDGKVTMGADSCASNDWHRGVIASRKIVRFTVSGSDAPLLIGMSGFPRFINIVQHLLRLPADNNDDAEFYLVDGFVPEVRSRMTAEGWTQTSEGRESASHGALIAYRGRLFEFESNWQLVEPASGIAATGSGFAFALGAMDATNAKSGKGIVEAGLRAAERFNPYVMSPFHIEEAS